MRNLKIVKKILFLIIEAVANADDALGEIFLEERTPSEDELTVIPICHKLCCGFGTKYLFKFCFYYFIFIIFKHTCIIMH